MNHDLSTRDPNITRDQYEMTEADLPSICHVLREWATHQPDEVAYSFVEPGQPTVELTHRQLDLLASSVARQVRERVEPGECALLVFPPGLEFVVAFFGCLYAQVLPVPTTYPKANRPASRLAAIQTDCNARIALSVEQVVELQGHAESGAKQLSWVAIPDLKRSLNAIQDQLHANYSLDDFDASQLAFLQYTSGSTADPKGVMISHRNVMHNLDLIQAYFQVLLREKGTPRPTSVFWLPAYHDMGLVGALLTPLYSGWQSTLMAPATFLKEPGFWLQTIANERAGITGAPNFAFEHCLKKVSDKDLEGLDLGSLELIFCGAEPIRWKTLNEFATRFKNTGLDPKAIYPCYGMAESTLMATGPDGPQALTALELDRQEFEQNRIAVRKELKGLGDDLKVTSESAQTKLSSTESGNERSTIVVSCGQPHSEMQVRILDPKTKQALSEDQIGEIWLASESIAAGYWQKQDATDHSFPLHLDSADFDFQSADEQRNAETELGNGRLAPRGDSRRILSTGDLGFLHRGELYVTGRSKDLIIIRGQNHYPQEIEASVSELDETFVPGGTVAVSIEGEGAGEVLMIFQEIRREFRNLDWRQLAGKIREAISQEFELDVAQVAFVRPAQLPRTSSGKMQRSRCRELFRDDQLKLLDVWKRAEPKSESSELQPLVVDSTEGVAASQVKIQAWMIDWILHRGEESIKIVDKDTPFAEMGLDSISAVELSFELEQQLGILITPEMAWEHPTPSGLSERLAEALCEAS